MYGIEAGFGKMLWTMFFSYYKSILLITGVKDSSSNPIILSLGFSSSEIKINFPLPFEAHPLINASEQPFPMPMLWTLLNLVFS